MEKKEQRKKEERREKIRRRTMNVGSFVLWFVLPKTLRQWLVTIGGAFDAKIT
jgi:hypothetical protein